MNKFIYLLLICVLPLASTAQRNEGYFEMGLFLGGSNYKGELSERITDITDWNTAVGLNAKYRFDRTVALRLGVNVGKISGSDFDSEDPFTVNRNLSFRSMIYEVSLATEIHLMTGPAFNKTAHPFINIGLAGFYFNPQTRYDGRWVDLQPLGTEGQGTLEYDYAKPYSLYQFSMPVGAGIEIALTKKWYLSIEGGYRFTLTDFLDDVSGYYADPNAIAVTHGVNSDAFALYDRRIEKENYPDASGFYPFQNRGNPKDRDGYFFFGITITKKFKPLACNAF